jgi:uncharacterized membrane protein YphA (DoxX/SURF4 family)
VSTRVKDVIGLIFRLSLAGILGYAGLIKVFEEDGARTAVLAYRIFPVEWSYVLGWALPAVEILLAILLLLGLFTRWAALVSGLLMLAFIVGIASVWVRGYSIDCGCFGGGGDISPEGRTWRYTSEILRDLMFAGMAAWLVVRPRSLWSIDREPLHDLDEPDVYAEVSERQV